MGISFSKSSKGEHPTLEELTAALSDVKVKLDKALLIDLDYFITASRSALPDVMSEIEKHVKHQDIVAFRGKLHNLITEYEKIAGWTWWK